MDLDSEIRLLQEQFFKKKMEINVLHSRLMNVNQEIMAVEKQLIEAIHEVFRGFGVASLGNVDSRRVGKSSAPAMTDPNAERRFMATEVIRAKKELEKASARVIEANRMDSSEGDQQLKELNDAYNAAWQNFCEIQACLRRVCKEPEAVGSSGAEGSSQGAARDVKTGTGLEVKQSGESSNVRAGNGGKDKDLVLAGGGDSAQSEQKKNGDVSTDAEGGQD